MLSNLIELIKTGSSQAVDDFLKSISTKDRSNLLNSISQDSGFSPLGHALMHVPFLKDMVIALIEHGAEINKICVKEGDLYPLHLAIIHGDYGLVMSLLARGANSVIS
jgi:hypothetical protein